MALIWKANCSSWSLSGCKSESPISKVHKKGAVFLRIFPDSPAWESSVLHLNGLYVYNCDCGGKLEWRSLRVFISRDNWSWEFCVITVFVRSQNCLTRPSLLRATYQSWLHCRYWRAWSPSQRTRPGRAGSRGNCAIWEIFAISITVQVSRSDGVGFRLFSAG